MTLRWLTLLGGAALLLPSISNCGGQSARTEEQPSKPTGGDGGTAGTTSGTSGTAQGGSGGSAPISLCRLPAASGPCNAYFPSYWFDAGTGVCMPFVYGGCEGNDNRFATLEECYAACGGQGDRDDAACTRNTDCVAKRLSEPCCSTELDEFVGVNAKANFECTNRSLGCDVPCAADCDYLPEDGFIGATCTEGHCIPFDARARGFTSCNVDADCAFVYGMGCCGNDCCSPGFCSGCLGEACPLEQIPSKLVSIRPNAELRALVCDPDVYCATIDLCEYPEDRRPMCVSGACTIVDTRGAE